MLCVVLGNLLRLGPEGTCVGEKQIGTRARNRRSVEIPCGIAAAREWRTDRWLCGSNAKSVLKRQLSVRPIRTSWIRAIFRQLTPHSQPANLTHPLALAQITPGPLLQLHILSASPFHSVTPSLHSPVASDGRSRLQHIDLTKHAYLALWHRRTAHGHTHSDTPSNAAPGAQLTATSTRQSSIIGVLCAVPGPTASHH